MAIPNEVSFEARLRGVLIVREAQMRVLRDAALSDFRRRLSIYVRSFRPDAAGAEISRVCDRVISDCAAYSIERECDIARYAGFLLRSGEPERLSRPEQNILLAHGVPAEERLSRLEESVAAKRER
jgi:hypothetical protein